MKLKRLPVTPAERTHCLDVRDHLAKQACAPLDPQTGTCLDCGRMYEYIQYKKGFCSYCRIYKGREYCKEATK